VPLNTRPRNTLGGDTRRSTRRTFTILKASEIRAELSLLTRALKTLAMRDGVTRLAERARA